MYVLQFHDDTTNEILRAHPFTKVSVQVLRGPPHRIQDRTAQCSAWAAHPGAGLHDLKGTIHGGIENHLGGQGVLNSEHQK